MSYDSELRALDVQAARVIASRAGRGPVERDEPDGYPYRRVYVVLYTRGGEVPFAWYDDEADALLHEKAYRGQVLGVSEFIVDREAEGWEVVDAISAALPRLRARHAVQRQL